MIISASRRTDIPAFYSDWFFRRLEEGYVYVRNPMNFRRIYSVSLTRDVVDGIVFWTKNPKAMLPRLDLLDAFPYYFQFTLTPYDKSIEPNLEKTEVIETFKRLSDEIGKDQVIWRYDPLIVTLEFDERYHYSQFERLASELCSFTNKCVISFIDFYPKTKKQLNKIQANEIDDAKKQTILRELSNIATAFNLKLETCAEAIDLSGLGIDPSRCVNADLVSKISGIKLDTKKDRNQRKACRCHTSIDIGAYNTCPHGCIYCYATFSRKACMKNIKLYDISSPLLCGVLTDEDILTERKISSFAIGGYTVG